jgi:UDP-N-acetylmuramate--alanine ligase
MIQLNSITHLYFIGIGGIGMSALARFFHASGRQVAGYDKTETQLTRELQSEGITVTFDGSLDAFDWSVYKPESTLVVYTPAVPADHAQLQWFMQNGFEVYKRAKVLGVISEGLKSICISGTHGKTTTSTLTAHLLKQSQVDCHAFLGGISKNYHTNYLSSPQSQWVVLEADEFDRSFLHLTPQLAVITATDADHLDIYGDAAQFSQAFIDFSQKLKPGGVLLVKKSVDLKFDLPKDQTLYFYSLDKEADFYARNIVLENGFYRFSLVTPWREIDNLILGVPGLLNVENAVAASAMALLSGVSDDELRNGLASFAGIRRRFDYWLRNEKFCLIDDYAHHPEEINATARSIRAIYPDKNIVAVFQPHLYSRTKDFYREFAAALSQFNNVVLLDIYPARELPIEGVDSQMIARLMTAPVKVCSKPQLPEALLALKPDIVLTMGAGDIDKELPTLSAFFKAHLIDKVN